MTKARQECIGPEILENAGGRRERTPPVNPALTNTVQAVHPSEAQEHGEKPVVLPLEHIAQGEPHLR